MVLCGIFATHELDTGYTGTESEFAQGVITVLDVRGVQAGAAFPPACWGSVVFATRGLDAGYTGTESEFAQGVITVPDVCEVQDC
jgi:hypothetical protein